MEQTRHFALQAGTSQTHIRQFVRRLRGMVANRQKLAQRMGALAVITASFSGCGGAFNNLPSVNIGDVLSQTPLGEIRGQIYGGQSPVYLNHVYLMKASHNGYGAASTSILTPASNTSADTTVLGTSSNPAYYVSTDAYGDLDITGDYSCTYNATHPEQSDLLYLLGLGGQSNFSFNALGNLVPGTNNPYIGEMAVLGQCPPDGTFAGHLSYVYVNEVSTVAAAYALAPFATSSYAVGSPSSSAAETGLTNAFANANLLYDIQGSSVLHEARKTPPGSTGTVPYLLVDTLANIVANCVNASNTGGGAGTSTGPTNTICKALWSNTGSGSTDTASALIYLAQHPTKNVSALYSLQGSNFAFVDRLTTVPNDLSMAVNFTSTAFSNALDVAVDGSGNAWVTNSDGLLSKVTPTGSLSSFNVPGASYVAIDTNGHPWVTSDISNGPVYELSNAGAQLYSYTSQAYSDFNRPKGIALDGKGNAYVANSGGGQTLLTGLLGNVAGDIVRINGRSTAATFSSYYQGALVQLANTIPAVSQVAVDSTGNMWLSGDTSSCVLLIFCAGENVQSVSGSTSFANLSLLTPVTNLVSSLLSTQVGSISCFIFCSVSEQTNGLAIDGANTAWVAVSGSTDKLVSISSSGVQSSGLTGGGLNNPQGVAIDGAGNVFIANTGNASISEYASQGTKGFLSGSNGIFGASNSASSPSSMLNKPSNLDIDQAGSVWVVNSAANNGSITEFIGLAAPAVRPLATAASTASLASKP
jgi:hypothetical protein